MTRSPARGGEAAGHTPGPWHLFLQNRVIEIWDRADSDSAKAIVHWTGFDNAQTGRHETEANARLIASAPDLYEAGADAFEVLTLIVATSQDAATRNAAQKVADKLHDALAKARTESGQ